MRTAFLASLLAAALFPTSLTAQASVSASFRAHTRELGLRLALAADVMPADAYSFKATPTQSSFAQLLERIDAKTRHLCARLSGERLDARAVIDSVIDKPSLVRRLQDSFAWCDNVFASLTDVGLADSVVVDMREAFPFAPRARTRALTMTVATAYWAESYGQVAQFVRLNGKVPPTPCGRPEDDTTSCDSGLAVCRPTRPGGGGSVTATFTDAGNSVRSDGRGTYKREMGLVVAVSQVLVVYAPRPIRDTLGARKIVVDLSDPVPNGGGVPHGVVREHSPEVAAQWYTETNKAQHSMLDIPVGQKVVGQQLSVVFAINGVRHALQMGPQPLGHCFSDGSTMFGEGTSKPTIERPTENQWVVDVPPGSVGRLFDIHLGEPNAVNKGLYHVSLRVVFERVLPPSSARRPSNNR